MTGPKVGNFRIIFEKFSIILLGGKISEVRVQPLFVALSMTHYLWLKNKPLLLGIHFSLASFLTFHFQISIRKFLLIVIEFLTFSYRDHVLLTQVQPATDQSAFYNLNWTWIFDAILTQSLDQNCTFEPFESGPKLHYDMGFGPQV